MLNTLKRTALTMLCIATLATPAVAEQPDIFYGGWTRDVESRQPERLGLADYDNRIAIELEGTNHICKYKGDSYKAMNDILAENGDPDQPITWWVLAECENETYVHICLRAREGQKACDNYKSLGWKSAME